MESAYKVNDPILFFNYIILNHKKIFPLSFFSLVIRKIVHTQSAVIIQKKEPPKIIKVLGDGTIFCIITQISVYKSF